MPHGPGLSHEAVFRITTDRAGMIYRALLPELADEVNPRSVTSCDLEGDRVLLIRVRARDIPALRAALNMILRLVTVADEIQQLV